MVLLLIDIGAVSLSYYRRHLWNERKRIGAKRLATMTEAAAAWKQDQGVDDNGRGVGG